jgi:hypothetical protein
MNESWVDPGHHHVRITYDLDIHGMIKLSINESQFTLTRCPYSNMSAVNYTDYLGNRTLLQIAL